MGSDVTTTDVIDGESGRDREILGPPILVQVYDRAIAERLLIYSVLLRHRYQLPVRSILLLLRPAADGPAASEEVLRQTQSAADTAAHT